MSSRFISPKKYKFSKSFSGKRSIAKADVKRTIRYGVTALVVCKSTRLSSFQYEALRFFFKRSLKTVSGSSKIRFPLFFRLLPNTPITKKPTGVRLGCGKGIVRYWTVVLKPGDILLEIGGVYPVKESNVLKRYVTSSLANLNLIVYRRVQRWTL